MKKTVVFDFDGVIHSYTSGWKGIDVIPDPPVPGIKEAIGEIRDAGYEVVVVSTRCATLEGLKAVFQWLCDHDIAVNDVRKDKPPAIVYIDDRAICFDGDSAALLGKIQRFKAWNK
jgi:phosphoglycolate phosphatase-like HAD superfamily hydrolase